MEAMDGRRRDRRSVRTLAGRSIITTTTGEDVDALVGVALIALNAAPIGLALSLDKLHGRPTA